MGGGLLSVKTVPGSGQTKKSFANRERALSAVYFQEGQARERPLNSDDVITVVLSIKKKNV